MKRKVVKVSSSKNFDQRLGGVGLFRVTDRDPHTGDRMVLWVLGTREQAEGIEVDSRLYENKQTIDFSEGE